MMMIFLFGVLSEEQRALVERIFHEHHIHFRRISLNIVKTEEIAEDAISTAFIKSWIISKKSLIFPVPK